MSYLFMAIESQNIDKVERDLVKLCALDAKDLIVAKAGQERRKFRQFHLIADLYIWTSKYWYGTYEEKLVFVRIKNLDIVPALFALKYVDEIRLAIKSDLATVVKKEDEPLLNKTHKESLNDFNEERIRQIEPGMLLLEKNWSTLISNRNPYPQKPIARQALIKPTRQPS